MSAAKKTSEPLTVAAMEAMLAAHRAGITEDIKKIVADAVNEHTNTMGGVIATNHNAMLAAQNEMLAKITSAVGKPKATKAAKAPAARSPLPWVKAQFEAGTEVYNTIITNQQFAETHADAIAVTDPKRVAKSRASIAPKAFDALLEGMDVVVNGETVTWTRQTILDLMAAEAEATPAAEDTPPEDTPEEDTAVATPEDAVKPEAPAAPKTKKPAAPRKPAAAKGAAVKAAAKPAAGKPAAKKTAVVAK